jgi:hypothetical protein
VGWRKLSSTSSVGPIPGKVIDMVPARTENRENREFFMRKIKGKINEYEFSI